MNPEIPSVASEKELRTLRRTVARLEKNRATLEAMWDRNSNLSRKLNEGDRGAEQGYSKSEGSIDPARRQAGQVSLAPSL